MPLVRGNIFQEHSAPRGVMPTELNIARYKNTVSAIAWVQLGQFVLYLPIILDSFSQIQVFMTSIYLNSSLNPFLYCWKIGEAKQAVKDTIRLPLWATLNPGVVQKNAKLCGMDSWTHDFLVYKFYIQAIESPRERISLSRWRLLFH